MNPLNHLKTLFAALICVLVIQGCAQPDASQAQESGDQQFFRPPNPDVFAGSHILIAYQGAMRADSAITRTKEEALAEAQRLLKELKANPEKFEDYAKEHSDGPSGENGGNLNTWQKGRMVPEFDNAIEKLEFGAIADEPVETSFGYHIMRRNDTNAPHFGGYGFIIGTAGLRNVPPTVTRDSAATATLAAEIKAKINGANFEELANEHNDFGDGPMFLGGFKDGDPVSPEIMDMLKSLNFEEVGGPLELPVGQAFIKRVKLERRSGAHILVAYQGAERANPSITRTKEEALAEAQRILKLAQDAPDTFADLAAEHSDGPSGTSGGELGVWFRGAMVPEFDDAMDSMKDNDITAEPVESPFGYHIIMKKAAAE